MSFIDRVAGWLGGRGSVAVPPAPLPHPEAPRILLGDEDLRWDSMEAIKRALQGRAVIRGRTVDLNGDVLSGRHITHPAERQDENSPGIKISVPELRLIRGWVVDVPGGIKVQAPGCRFVNLTFLQIGEDAISTTRREAIGLSLIRCRFWNQGGDKTIQLNQAGGAYLEDLEIYGGKTAIRVQKAAWKTAGTAMVANRVAFTAVDTAWNVDGGARVQCNGATFKGVRKKVVYGTNGGGGKVVMA